MENTSKYSALAAGESSHPMDFLLTEEIEVGIPEEGEIRTGVVVEHLPGAILVDIGAKSEGIISGDELNSLTEEALEELAEGNEVQVYVLDPEDHHGNILLSYSRAAEANDWQTAERLQQNRSTHEGKIVGYNKGGLLVQVGMLRGFVPISQLGPARRINRKMAVPDQLRQFVGERIMTKVIEVDRARNRLILSERAASKEIREARRNTMMEDLEEGEVRTGRVVNLTSFGAFVDIGGIEGLVHLSELSWQRVNEPADVVKIGDEVEVYVLNVDKERQRIALSMKRLQTDPWSIVDEIYEVGQLLEANITKLTKFGAFARLLDEYELEGLIHISEMSEDRIQHPRDVVKLGQDVAVRVIRVDPEQRQLGLSIKQVASDRYMEADLAAALDDDSDI